MYNIKKFTSEYALYLQDESRKKGYADSISFPHDEAEVAEILRCCTENGTAVTVQGSRTGVGSGAVPFGGHVMSLEHFRKLEMDAGGDSVTAGAARSLKEINEFVRQNTADRLFLPPDPTETTASAGGMASCNSSGARTYSYGAMRNHIKRLRIVMADGAVLNLERGRLFAKKSTLELNAENDFTDSAEKEHTSNIGGDGVAVRAADRIPPKKTIRINLPRYEMPKVKNAAGYYVHENMDAIDLFIGAEGTLGVITEVEFSLTKKPELIWGVISYFEKEEAGLEFSAKLKNFNAQAKDQAKNIISIEFFDKGSLQLLRKNGWNIGKKFAEAVFTELKAENMQEMVENIRLIEACIIEAGADPDDAQVAGSSRSFLDFKEMRHATPEAVNKKIAENKRSCPVITKLGSDMSVPPELFERTVKMYKDDLKAAGLDYVMFGHIGNEHLHVNIISKNEEEYFKGKDVFLKWAEWIGKIKGSVSAEHGVGKLKRDFLLKMYGKEAVDEMRELKKTLDPKGILGRDNIFLWNVDKK